MYKEIYKDEGYRFMVRRLKCTTRAGTGWREEIYQECLEIELELRGIPLKANRKSNVSTSVASSRNDMFQTWSSTGVLVVELKAVTGLGPEHEAQLINYLRITGQPVGYLVNFGQKGGLEWKRFILSELIGTEGKSLRRGKRGER